MAKAIYLGIDPGKAGFITAFDGEDFTFYEMPTHKVPTDKTTKTGKVVMKTEFYEFGLVELAAKIKIDFPKCSFYGAIEEVTGRAGWSAQNNFNFGYVAGMQKMILLLLRAEITMVRPAKWQSFMRQGYPNIKKASSTGKTQVNDPKAVAELIVKTEYPQIDFRKTERARIFDNNKVDSFLICLYLYRINN